MQRSHHCNQLRKSDSGKSVQLFGWIDRRRDHGGIIFIDLRDKWGITQVVFSPEHSAELHAQADTLRNEWVIAVEGVVRPRPGDMINPNRATGEVEVLADRLTVLNKAETAPLSMNDFTETSREGEELRLKYRYLDLRRPWVQKNLLLKSRFLAATRRWFEANGFEDIETPILCKSTPEGARDYIVPSRVHPGEFYALPQSPQTYKQLLMIAGFDRYYQIAKCFRDEDLRADRQPEFTQIDAEMSFVEAKDVRATFDNYLQQVMGEIWPELMKQVSFPLPTITYADAMLKYGSDKPDLRLDWEIKDVTSLVSRCDFAVFRNVAQGGGVIRGLAAKGCVDLTRKAIDDLTQFVGRYGAKGLVWMRVKEQNEVETQVGKFFKTEELNALRDATGAAEGDMMFFIAAEEKVAATAMGQLRLEVARQKNLLNPKEMKMLWVIDFPMFEWSETEKRYMAMHHPFTAPIPEDLEKFATGDLGTMVSQGYDLVLNGVEVGGGSIRIHNPEVQKQAFAALGLTEEEVVQKFGYFVDAFRYGAPPHGGLAFGVDRILATMEGIDSIKDFIAFPKTSAAAGLMEECPSPVDPKQLLETHISTRISAEAKKQNSSKP